MNSESANEPIFYQSLFFFLEDGIIGIQKSTMPLIRYDLQSMVKSGAVLQGPYLLQMHP